MYFFFYQTCGVSGQLLLFITARIVFKEQDIWKEKFCTNDYMYCVFQVKAIDILDI